MKEHNQWMCCKTNNGNLSPTESVLAHRWVNAGPVFMIVKQRGTNAWRMLRNTPPFNRKRQSYRDTLNMGLLDYQKLH